jgi:hypothetical protein
MQSIRFLGRVLPWAAQVSVQFPASIKWPVDGVGDVEFTTRIENSSIDVECRLHDYQVEHLADLYRRALDISRALVDLVAFKNGWGLDVAFDALVTPDGTRTQLLMKDESLAPFCTAYSLDQQFDEIIQHTLQSPQLFMALRDLIESITLPHVSLVNCARVMDALRGLVAPKVTDDGRAWQCLRSALRIDKAYIMFITDNSKNPRHARPGHTHGMIATEVTHRSWAIMNRYLEYLKGGEVELDPVRFPTLTAP